MEPEKSRLYSLPVRYSEVVCIGAGLSAISLGAQLRIQYNFTDIHFYEKNDGIGGTWWANTYPGAACDVPSALYSFSFAPNPNWSCVLPSQKEIKAYIDGVAEKYNIPQRTTLSTEAVNCTWIDQLSRWRILLRDLKSGEEYVHECRVLFTAAGLLVEPNVPNFLGMENFRGKVIHSARWDHSVNLDGKRVVLIGNGCSAAQIVPAIADKVGSVVQVFRTAHWILEPPGKDYSAWERWIFKNVPFALKLHRCWVFLSMEKDFRMFGMSESAQQLRNAIRERATKYLYASAPKEYRDIMLPDYEIACKRRVVNTGYFDSLHRPNVTLVKERRPEITPTGVRAGGKTHRADVIVLATGFQTSGKFFKGMEIVGRNGITAEEHWEEMGGPGAYNTSAMHGFPNFFMLLGPNSVTGHTSAIFASESMVDYTLSVLKPVLRGQASRVEIKRDSEEKYVEHIQGALRNTVFNAGCASWYTSNGWNAMTYPFTQFHYYWRSRFVKAQDWNITYTRNTFSAWKPLPILASVLVGICAGTAGRELLLKGLSSVWGVRGSEFFMDLQILAK